MPPKPCWILCSPRTGSSFLCELLNKTDCFPALEHPKMRKNRGVLEIGQSFGEWFRLYNDSNEFLSNPTPYTKALFHQFFEVFSNIPPSGRYSAGFYPETYKVHEMMEFSRKHNAEYIRSVIFPDIRYLLLKRDVIENAVSLYFARITKSYHAYNHQFLEKYMNLTIEIDDSKLLRCYNDAKINSCVWDNFLYNDNFLTIEYDDLTNNTKHTLTRIKEYLDLDFNVDQVISKIQNNPRVLRMTRPEKDFFENRLNRLCGLLEIKL